MVEIRKIEPGNPNFPPASSGVEFGKPDEQKEGVNAAGTGEIDDISSLPLETVLSNAFSDAPRKPVVETRGGEAVEQIPPGLQGQALAALLNNKKLDVGNATVSKELLDMLIEGNGDGSVQ